MKIEKISQYKLKITLSCTEILQMNSHIHPVETSNLINSLLQTLDTEYQFSIMNQRIMLEMIPSRQDGCNIFLTALQSDKVTNNEKKQALIFSFLQFESVIEAGRLLKLRYNGAYSLYLLDERYYLVIHAENPDLYREIETRLSDLGEVIPNPKLYESILLEYAEFVANEEMLYNYL